MTKEQKTYLILGAGALAIWWFYRMRQAVTLTSAPTNSSGLGGSTFAGTPTIPQSPSRKRIDDMDINTARMAVNPSDPLARRACMFPNRWINTVSGPYFGKCVQSDVFSQWINLPSDIQLYATDQTVTEFLRSIGR